MTDSKNTKEKIPEGWVETTLGKVCKISSSKRIYAKEYQTSGVPFFRGKEVTERFNGGEISTELFITEKKYQEIKEKYGVPTENDILLTSVGTLGNPYLVERDFKFYFKDGNLTWFHSYDGIDPIYLFYWIISSEGKEGLSHAVIGSTQQAYTIVALKKVEINLPSLSEQRAIANVLSSFDDKIELLREQNKTLEQTAQTIFKEWFGKYSVERSDELPEGWRVGKIGDVVNLKQGKYIKASEISEHKNDDYLYPAYGGSSIRGYLKSFAYEKPQVSLTCRGNGCGLIQYIKAQSSVTNSCMVLEDMDSPLNSRYLYLLTQKIDFEPYTSGSAQPQITATNFKGMEVLIPSKEILQKFDALAQPMFDKIRSNSEQIQSLEKTRDTLLPKLMRGEVRVK